MISRVGESRDGQDHFLKMTGKQSRNGPGNVKPKNLEMVNGPEMGN